MKERIKKRNERSEERVKQGSLRTPPASQGIDINRALRSDSAAYGGQEDGNGERPKGTLQVEDWKIEENKFLKTDIEKREEE